MSSANQPPLIQVGSYVALSEQVGVITKIDSTGKCAVALINGPTKWRRLGDVVSIFGSSGRPKQQLKPADFVRLPDKKSGTDAVGQVLKLEGGRVNIRLLRDDKVLWRGISDLLPPFDDAPVVPLLSEAKAGTAAAPPPSPPAPVAAKPSGIATAPPPTAPMAPAPAPVAALPRRLSSSGGGSSAGSGTGSESTFESLRVQTSGVGGGDDIEVSHTEIVSCGTVGAFKALLRARRPAWADLEIRLLVNGEIATDDGAPADPLWCKQKGSLASSAAVVAMALRRKPSVVDARPSTGAVGLGGGGAVSATTANAATAATTTSAPAPAPAPAPSRVQQLRQPPLQPPQARSELRAPTAAADVCVRLAAESHLDSNLTLSRPRGPAKRRGPSPPRVREAGDAGGERAETSLAGRIAAQRQARAAERAALISPRGGGSRQPQ